MARHVRDPSSLCQSLFSSAALKSVLNKLTRDVSDEFESSSTLFPKDDIGKLKETVSSISDALPDVEELAINSEVADLVLDLTEVAYDIEDLLDEAATQRLILEKKVSGIKYLFPGINNPWNPVKPRRGFASDLKIQIRRLDEIAAKLSYSSSMKNQPDVPNPTFFTETRAALEISSYNQKVVGSEETITGREEDKERLIHCILSPSSSTQHPVVINVTGDGGIGKTTLVKLVCNDSRVSSSFNFVSWASYDGTLSYEDGLKRLTTEINASAEGQRNVTSKGMSLGALEDELCSILQGRKFLLVVDGIKHELLSVWKQYLGLLMVGSRGSTVILTSWSSIDIRGSIKTFKLERMLERECWSLFKRISALDEDAEQADPSLNNIGRSIVKKCGGSPLAVKTLASLLRNNKDRHYWEQIQQSKLWGQCNEAWVSWFISLQRVPVELIPSYVDADRVDVVWFWMAQGLLQSTKESDDIRDIGLIYFNELQSMSLLPVNYIYGIDCLLARDFRECVSEKQTGHVNDRFLPSTRVSLQWTEDMLLPYKFPKVSSTPTCKARTLRVRSFIPDIVSISNLKHLRVLSIDWSGLVELPKSIGNLKLLRYLSLSFYQLQALPDSICKLVNLQTLDLSNCLQLKTFPRNMHKLVSMRHLLLPVYNRSSLDKALKGLTLHHLQISSWENLPSLEKGLQYQTGLRTLKIHDCPDVTSLPNSINCHSSLNEFSILDCDNLDLKGWKGLFDLRSLRSLRIQDLPLLTELPEGLQSSADSLEHFVIRRCENLKALPESLERCTRLVDIIIECCPKLDLIGWEGLFYLRSLKSLWIQGLPLLSELPDRLQSSADSLEHFVISDCHNLRKLPESLEHCTRLVDIIIEYCPKLIALPQGIHALKNLQVLKIRDCPHLVQTVTGNDWHLISHVPIIYLDGEIRRNMDTSTVKERPGTLNLFPSKEIRPASTKSPSEIIPVHENQSSYLSDYDHPLSSIQSYSVQSQYSALPTAEHPHAASIERSGASPPYGMNINLELKAYQDEKPRSQECHTTLRRLGDETHTSKKVVLRLLSMTDEKTKRRAMKAVGDIEGVDSIAADLKEQKLTVTGEMDPVAVVKKLRKVGKADLLSVGPAKKEKEEEKREEKKEGAAPPAAAAAPEPDQKEEEKKKEAPPPAAAAARDPSSLRKSLYSSAALKNVLNKLAKDVSEECPQQAAPVEHSGASPPYGMNTNVEQALAHVIHHPDADATGLEHQGASSNEEAINIQVLELEKEVEGKIILFLFGEGCEFQKDMLIQLWIALELFTDEEIGANYFGKLVSEGYILRSVNSFYKVNIGKLNTESDMISDKRNYVILDNGSQNDFASTETLHVSVVCDKIDESVFTTLRRFNKLRILLFLRNYGTRLHEVPRDLFLCYESLVALDLSGSHIKELPSSAEKMINLRYLDLSWTFVELLPERIYHFKMLQTLKLKGCSCLHRLPKELKGLTELRHLDLDVLGQLASFPEGIGALVELRTLSAFPVGIEEGFRISELKCLDNLTGEFCIAKLERVQSAEEAKGASLSAKSRIKKLELRWSDNQFQEPKNEDEAILEKLCPCSDLEEIQILCYSGTRFPGWIADVSFHKLVSISLFRCTHVYVLPSLEKLPALASLELVSLNSVANVSFKGEVGLAAFPKLKKLVVDEMLVVESWADAEEGDYPCLVNVSIKDCPKLPELPSLLYLPSIKYLEVSGCTKLAFVSDKQLSNSLLQLIVEDCPLIKERCSEMGGQDWHKIEQVPTIWIDQLAIKTNEDPIEDKDEDDDVEDEEDDDVEDEEDESYYWDVLE